MGFFVLPLTIALLVVGATIGWLQAIGTLISQIPGGSIPQIIVAFLLVIAFYAAVFFLFGWARKYKLPKVLVLGTVVLTIAAIIVEGFVWLRVVFRIG